MNIANHGILKTLVSLKEPSNATFMAILVEKLATCTENGRDDEHLTTLLICFLSV
jgi:hypothetical protein